MLLLLLLQYLDTTTLGRDGAALTVKLRESRASKLLPVGWEAVDSMEPKHSCSWSASDGTARFLNSLSVSVTFCTKGIAHTGSGWLNALDLHPISHCNSLPMSYMYAPSESPVSVPASWQQDELRIRAAVLCHQNPDLVSELNGPSYLRISHLQATPVPGKALQRPQASPPSDELICEGQSRSRHPSTSDSPTSSTSGSSECNDVRGEPTPMHVHISCVIRSIRWGSSREVAVPGNVTFIVGSSGVARLDAWRCK
ncbi:hypothetical protein DL93DRAFT_2097901 [Clavulina sp. PMI_390]|nr:hypothetical protein DL93DRAFT_2097901 [Clavulina sp. PMI_390]